VKLRDKLELIDKVARALQATYSHAGIDSFLSEFKIPPPEEKVTSNSKWIYAKAALEGIADETLERIASELNIALRESDALGSEPPRNWLRTSLFRLFISHISKDKGRATRLKECLERYGIDGFVAHEDVHPTAEWEAEIERALRVMDAFVAITTPGYSKSVWTQQEVGFAVARRVKIISFEFGEVPAGFISKQQALPRRRRTAEEIAKEIDTLLSEDDRTAARLQIARKAWVIEEDYNGIPF
jgi:hypothetical protein